MTFFLTHTTLRPANQEFDVLLVTTCSYGAGEPPANFTMMFEELMNNADTEGCEPLEVGGDPSSKDKQRIKQSADRL